MLIVDGAYNETILNYSKQMVDSEADTRWLVLISLTNNMWNFISTSFPPIWSPKKRSIVNLHNYGKYWNIIHFSG